LIAGGTVPIYGVIPSGAEVKMRKWLGRNGVALAGVIMRSSWGALRKLLGTKKRLTRRASSAEYIDALRILTLPVQLFTFTP
jgi:hypothetical protein